MIRFSECIFHEGHCTVIIKQQQETLQKYVSVTCKKVWGIQRNLGSAGYKVMEISTYHHNSKQS